MPKVSVIVPVYKVEKYIERCAVSLFEQTLDDIEYLFVNDCTPDKSMEILHAVMQRYPDRKNQIKIITHKCNKGQAGARFTGMKAMTGEYMIHCDPDDWVALDMYEKLYEVANKENADIVICNHYGVKNGVAKEVKVEFIYKEDGIETLNEHKFSPALWDKLIRRSIIVDNNIFPYEGINYAEDYNIVLRALFFSKKIIYYPIYGYYYFKENDNSISKIKYVELFKKYTIRNINLLDTFCEENHFPKLFRDYMKFHSKEFMLATGDYELWRSVWIESHRSIMKFKHYKLKYRLFFIAITWCPIIYSIYKKLYLKLS